MSSSLTQKHCVPCEGGVDPLRPDQYQMYLDAVPQWKVLNNTLLQCEFVLKDFTSAVEFVNKLAKLAESEGHHPDILIHDYKKVTITLSTHAIGGLSENDFIMAARINEILADGI